MLRKPKRKPLKPVTIITGLICKEAIVMASDSRTVQGVMMRDDVNKLIIVPSEIGDIVFGMSGAVAICSKCIDLIRGRVQGQRFRAVRDLVEIVDTTVEDEWRRVRTMIKDGLTITPDLGLMFSFYFKGLPNIWQIDFDFPYANEATSNFAAMGIGVDLAKFLLAENTHPDIEPQLGVIASILAVSRVKSHVAGCGGPTKVAILTPTRVGLRGIPSDVPSHVSQAPDKNFCYMIRYDFPEAKLFPQDGIEELEKTVIRKDDLGKRERNLQILKQLEADAEKEIQILNKSQSATPKDT